MLGAGSWGTALAIYLARLGHDVRLWGRDEGLMAALASRRENAIYLPGSGFPDELEVTADLAAALRQVRSVILAVPSHGLRAVLVQAAPWLDPQTLVVCASKGLEEHSLRRLSQVAAEVLPEMAEFAVLSGPSFARELVRGQPTAVVIASASASAIEQVQLEFRSSTLRLYGSADVVGVEIGGALKNIIAIAAGGVEGLGLGHNALAALITRGLAEISRLAVALGGQRETLAGLAGLGDLVLTCTGGLSRNRQLGIDLAQGRSLPEILSGTKMVAEGVRTTHAALALGAAHGVELPIAAQIASVLNGTRDAASAVYELMGRRQKHELH